MLRLAPLFWIVALLVGALSTGAPCTTPAGAGAECTALGPVDDGSSALAVIDGEIAGEDADGDSEDSCAGHHGEARRPQRRDWTRAWSEAPRASARDAVASHAPRGPPAA